MLWRVPPVVRNEYIDKDVTRNAGVNLKLEIFVTQTVKFAISAEGNLHPLGANLHQLWSLPAHRLFVVV